MRNIKRKVYELQIVELIEEKDIDFVIGPTGEYREYLEEVNSRDRIVSRKKGRLVRLNKEETRAILEILILWRNDEYI
jgi:hypothetical protein